MTRYWFEGETDERLAQVVPSERQLKFHRLKYYSFIHFGMNTFTDREWGDGTDDPKAFNPTALDTDQWCEVLKKSGSSGIIITAKHHDGFCLFDSKYTDYTVMNSPFGRDIVALLAESCKKYGLKLGIYLSPWDRHEKKYGTDEYNDYFVNQLEELATNYGDIFCFWFDGACGEGPNGKKQVYDFERYYALIRRLMPQAVISVTGPDVRWIGNEGGVVRDSEWSVLPSSLADFGAVAEKSQHSENEGGKMTSLTARSEDLGSRSVLGGADELIWYPAEADVSVTYGWFYHEDSYYENGVSSRTPEQLADIYFKSIGGNASLLLNVPVNRMGLIGEREKATLECFRKIIDKRLENQITEYELDGEYETGGGDPLIFADRQYGIKITLEKEQTVRTIFLSEDISQGQRVENFIVTAKTGGDEAKIYEGTTIGSGKYILLDKPLYTNELHIYITEARLNPVFDEIKLFG